MPKAPPLPGKPLKLESEIRSYANSPSVSVWIVRRDGPITTGLLHGEMFEATVVQLLDQLGLIAKRNHLNLERGGSCAKSYCQP